MMTTTIADTLPIGIRDGWPETPEEQHQFLAEYGSYLGLQAGIEDQEPTWDDLRTSAVSDPYFGDLLDNWAMQEALDDGIAPTAFEPIFRSSANVAALIANENTFLEGAKKLGAPISEIRAAILDSPQSRHLRNLSFSELDISDYASDVQQRHVSNVRQYIRELQSSIDEVPKELEPDDFERD